MQHKLHILGEIGKEVRWPGGPLRLGIARESSRTAPALRKKIPCILSIDIILFSNHTGSAAATSKGLAGGSAQLLWSKNDKLHIFREGGEPLILTKNEAVESDKLLLPRPIPST